MPKVQLLVKRSGGRWSCRRVCLLPLNIVSSVIWQCTRVSALCKGRWSTENRLSYVVENMTGGRSAKQMRVKGPCTGTSLQQRRIFQLLDGKPSALNTQRETALKSAESLRFITHNKSGALWYASERHSCGDHTIWGCLETAIFAMNSTVEGRWFKSKQTNSKIAEETVNARIRVVISLKICFRETTSYIYCTVCDLQGFYYSILPAMSWNHTLANWDRYM